MDILLKLAQDFSLCPWQVEATVKLIDDGNTIPFIARYRKEATGSLDDQILRALHEQLGYLRNLEEQKARVMAAITEQGKMTDAILQALRQAATLAEVEDIYRPFRPKRKTRAGIAKARGLEPLADLLYAQQEDVDPTECAHAYVTKEVATPEEALQGARDILAERIADEPQGRKRLRRACRIHAALCATGTAADLGVYEMYREYTEPVSKAAGHRVLAMNRGEKEGLLKVTLAFDREEGMAVLKAIHIQNDSRCARQVLAAAQDAYSRLLFPSVEREIRKECTERASESAISVFAENTRHLLMQPPVKGRVTIGLDPGYRTGCKVAVVDANGNVLDTGVIYPAPPHNKVEQAKRTLKDMIKKYHVKMFAIGNGTASHETEAFAAQVIREMDCGITYMVVSEAGASVYSASKLAAQEFPEYDVSLRSAVSIARRLQDPLAELVKIDPKAIGVGQYQHDMPQSKLSAALDGVVEDCVNSVGVDLNTASVQLLSRVAGLSETVAGNIVAFRKENGSFTARTQLKKVSKLGAKTFEQCAGFLRISGGENVLDNTAVHPESYAVAEQLLQLCGVCAADLAAGQTAKIKGYVQSVGTAALAGKLGIGEPTLMDIIQELQKPGRDPRDELPEPMLRTDVLGIEDLKPGMALKGTVRNVVDFGAFVDIGVHQDGLVHISRMSTKYIRHPSDLLKVGDIVTVWVEGVEAEKKRISLTMLPPDSLKNRQNVDKCLNNG